MSEKKPQKIAIKNLTQTCFACPSQWEAQLVDDDRWLYIRYRHGGLTMGVGKTVDDAVMNTIVDREIGDDDGGFMTEDEMLKHLHLEVAR